MTLVTLVAGGHAAAREAAIARSIATAILSAAADPLPAPRASAAPPGTPFVALLEGLADGRGEPALAASPDVQILRIAAGCPCCIGNLTLRVTLNRILRRPPAQLYLGLASTAHLPQIRTFLSQPPYRDLLQLNPDLLLDSNE